MKDLRQSNSIAFTPAGTCYSVHGDAEAVIVFIHGVGMKQAVWQPQIDYFSKDYTVVVYDILGHGDSPMSPENAVLTDYADQLMGLVEHLGIRKFNLVGHSVGALISVEFALQHPDKVSAMVPLNIVYKRDQTQSQSVTARANQVLQQGRVTGIDTTLERWFAKKTNSETDQASLARIEVIRQYLNSVDPVGYGRTYKMFASDDKAFVGRLNEIKQPVLYLTGGHDPNSTAQMSEQMAQETPNGQAFCVANEAHMMAYISPDKVNPLIDRYIRAQA